jgi:hypothetical protein
LVLPCFSFQLCGHAPPLSVWFMLDHIRDSVIRLWWGTHLILRLSVSIMLDQNYERINCLPLIDGCFWFCVRVP